jgi:hypothetical protein
MARRDPVISRQSKVLSMPSRRLIYARALNLRSNFLRHLAVRLAQAEEHAAFPLRSRR